MNNSNNIKKTITEFISDLRENIFSNNLEKQIKLDLVETYFRTLPDKDISDHIIKKILPKKKYIEEKNIDFFVENKKEIFLGLPECDVDEIINMIVFGKISKDDVNLIFDYFKVLVVLGEQDKKFV